MPTKVPLPNFSLPAPDVEFVTCYNARRDRDRSAPGERKFGPRSSAFDTSIHRAPPFVRDFDESDDRAVGNRVTRTVLDRIRFPDDTLVRFLSELHSQIACVRSDLLHHAPHWRSAADRGNELRGPFFIGGRQTR